jgi:hypothetical protein
MTTYSLTALRKMTRDNLQNLRDELTNTETIWTGASKAELLNDCIHILQSQKRLTYKGKVI